MIRHPALARQSHTLTPITHPKVPPKPTQPMAKPPEYKMYGVFVKRQRGNIITTELVFASPVQSSDCPIFFKQYVKKEGDISKCIKQIPVFKEIEDIDKVENTLFEEFTVEPQQG